MMSAPHKALRALLAIGATALAAGAAAPAVALAATEAPGCTPSVTYDPTIKTWAQFFADGHNPRAVKDLGGGVTGSGGGAGAYGNPNGGVSNANLDGSAPTGAQGGNANPNADPNAAPRGRNLSATLLEYADYLAAATAGSPRVRIVRKEVGRSALGRPIAFYVLSTPMNINGLEEDAAYWRSVRDGAVSTEDAVEQAVTRPAFGWITATPHGDESAAGESIARQMYELAARVDCRNLQRLNSMDLFIQLVRNPDGRDAVTRATAWAFDPNRDFGTRNQVENTNFIPKINQYPGLFFIDAHQQGGSAYFFPPNEDPVHHEISNFSLSTIQDKVGPALQQAFNDTSTPYTNYSQYDLFAPEFGDTVPSLIMGAAGMTYEKGTGETYSRQVYDHYLAIDTTINAIADDKVRTLRSWIRQWSAAPSVDAETGEYGAIEQGRRCELQPNKLVSPLHDELDEVPADVRVCGYFYKPDQHTGDVASLMTNLQEVGVKVFRLNSAATLNGVKPYGQAAGTQTLPAGTLYIPMAQGQKHWIQAILGENPYIPYPYYYDVVTWSYGMQRGLAGDGYLVDQGSLPTDMTLVEAPDLGGVQTGASPVYAFNTDSMQGLGLVADLLDQGVNVFRSTEGFTAAGRRFFTGTAMVAAASLDAAQVDLSARAKTRQTPVYGLPEYPVARQQLTRPRIGVYTGAATIPNNPLYANAPNVTANTAPGHCSNGGNTAFCVALYTLRVKDKMPAATVVPVTTAQIAAGELASGGFTALINPTTAIANVPANATTGAPALPLADQVKAWVNAGGRFVGIGVNGAISARNSGLSNVSTDAFRTSATNPAAVAALPPNLRTPGSTYDATFDTSNPVAWGFDLGGWLYRSSTNDPLFDPASLGATYTTKTAPIATTNNPASTAVVSYATDQGGGQKYGLSVNATGRTQYGEVLVDGRPAVVSSTLGAGRSTVFGFDPFFRSWKEQDERLVLNAAMIPTTAVIPPPAPAARGAAPAARGEDPAPAGTTASRAPTAATTQEAAKPVPAAKLPTVPRVKTAPIRDRGLDVELLAKKRDLVKLRGAVKAAKLPRAVRRKLSYLVTRKAVLVSFRNVRTDDFHDRQEWVSSLMGQVKKRGIRLSRAQL